MRSIVAKILIWALGTFALSLTAFGVLSLSVSARQPGPTEFVSHTVALLRDDACAPTTKGGPKHSGTISAGSMPIIRGSTC